MVYPNNFNYMANPTNYMVQPQQTQNGGMISAPNEAFAFNYPVAPGNSVTFKDESQPFLYVKTMGLSQFDQPIFEKFRLVKEEEAPVLQSGQVQQAEFVLKSEFDALKAQVETFINSTKEGPSE